MKKIIKILSLCFAVVMLGLLTSGALAADDTGIVYQGEEKYVIMHNSEDALTATDLFDNMRQMMPGRTYTQPIVIRNEYKDANEVAVYLSAKPHDQTNLPSEAVLSATGDVDAMNEFLSQLHMKVIDTEGQVIYEASPDQPAQLTNSVKLGTCEYSEELHLLVSLSAPAELDNQYAFFRGEIDWIFQFEEIVRPTDGGDSTWRPVKTGDTTHVELYVVAVIAELSALAAVVIYKRKIGC